MGAPAHAINVISGDPHSLAITAGKPTLKYNSMYSSLSLLFNTYAHLKAFPCSSSHSGRYAVISMAG